MIRKLVVVTVMVLITLNIYAEEDSCALQKAIDKLPYICQQGKPVCSKGFEPIIGFDIDNVYQHLSGPLWPERARAASLLRKITDEDEIDRAMLLEKLKVMFSDEKEIPLVRQLAADTYTYLTDK